ncbi:hypothetical protein K1719_023842 [Acacia pycnantha]|nr:hypothetical protein K1719_023842 [Acacia pycnantha]
MSALTPAATPTSHGFVNLMETFTVEVQRAENKPFKMPLTAPFTIAYSRLEKVENVAVRVELRNGSVGWGETPISPFVTAEDLPIAMAEACLGDVSFIARDKYGASVVADESCRSLDDVSRIAEGNLADVVNIKLTKLGVVGALNIIDVAKAAGLNLMIGCRIETRLAIGFAGHLATGLGCFKFIDLDSPHLLSEDPVLEGYEVSGATYKFTNVRGHGGFLHWDNIARKKCEAVAKDICYTINLQFTLNNYAIPKESNCSTSSATFSTTWCSMRL